ncbi:hypothetical protein [Clostridium sp. ZS2-4]|uniref:hypothetical protein n=1 Tax=Clostridium sp. ZS2-4 TaxID=2987703 RepID=UPI00227C0D4B|nr:hypothetical protein [Clostridium sp. ZS2-4]MCY6354059.1 hypothetical protein [Clostridium sp. ZS2-4]
MFKLNNDRKKGIGMIEIVCSIAIFLILSSFIFSTNINNLKLNISNRKMNEYVEFLEALKAEMYCNHNYQDIIEMKNHNLLIINEENINIDSLKNKGIKNVFTEKRKEEIPYLIMSIEDDKEVLEISFQLYTQNKMIKSVWFKGAY